MGIPTVTALYGSLNAILNIALASRVASTRTRAGVSMGTGDSKELLVASRIHGNNAEFVPLAIVVLLLAELCGGASVWLHVAGGVLLLARVAHVIGMPLKAPNPFRVFGVAGTWGVIVVLSGWLLWLRSHA